MAEKKLLNVTFKPSPDSEYAINIGCNSSDNISRTQPSNLWYDSKDDPLKQTGCLFYVPNVDVTETNDTRQSNLYITLHDKLGYGTRVNLCPGSAYENISYYLNGLPVDLDGVPQPYVRWENGVGGNNHPVLVYYRADGTRVGLVYSYYLGTYFGQDLTWVAGKLYTDGTFTGSAGAIRPKSIIPGLTWSHKYYEWRCDNDRFNDYQLYENKQLINEDVITDLLEYLPIEPEGSFSDDGEGDFDASSDPIGIPGVPGISPLDTGLVNMYQFTNNASDIGELHNFSQLLWDPQGFVANVLALFQNPMEGVVNLSMCPIITDAIVPGQPIVIGNFVFPGITGSRVTDPYKRINFGTIYLNEFWGNFADWSPYTTCSIYLPYVGVQQLSINDLMGGGINLWANCDIFTGSIQYFLFSAQNNPRYHGHQSVLYSWSGNMKYNIPLTGSNFNETIIRTIADTATTAGSMLSTANTTSPDKSSSAPIVNPLNLLGHTTVFSRGAGSGGSPGSLGCQYPYLILERPELTMADNYEHTIGVPNENTDYIKNYSGYVKVRGIHIEISSATSNEISEIESLLMGGVIV